MYYAYILQNPTGLFYKGHSNNINDRIKRHNHGRVPYTKNKGPWNLVYYETFISRSEAVQREIQFKNLNKEKTVQLINGLTNF